MISVSAIAFCAVAVGAILATMLGQTCKDRLSLLGIFGLAVAGVALGVSLSFATGLVHTLCFQVGFCETTTDTTVWGITYPAIFIPVYWIAMFMGTVIASHTSEPASPSAGAGAAEIASALKKFRSGVPISETCTACKTVLTVKPAKLKPGRDSRALRVNCECGVSNGTYQIDRSSA